MEERTKKTLQECKKLEVKLSESEKEKKNLDKKYTQVLQDKYTINPGIFGKNRERITAAQERTTH